MRIVIDASVAVKWIMRQPSTEPNVDKALALLRRFRAGSHKALVPPHFTTEVLAVVARLRPQRIPITFGILSSAGLEVVATDTALRRAADLAINLQHHMFDTLYHAVAIEVGATLITSDHVYFAKAASRGSIQLLKDLQI